MQKNPQNDDVLFYDINSCNSKLKAGADVGFCKEVWQTGLALHIPSTGQMNGCSHTPVSNFKVLVHVCNLINVFQSVPTTFSKWMFPVQIK